MTKPEPESELKEAQTDFDNVTIFYSVSWLARNRLTHDVWVSWLSNTGFAVRTSVYVLWSPRSFISPSADSHCWGNTRLH